MRAHRGPVGFALTGMLLSPVAVQANRLSCGQGVVQSAAIDTEGASTTRRRGRP